MTMYNIERVITIKHGKIVDDSSSIRSKSLLDTLEDDDYHGYSNNTYTGNSEPLQNSDKPDS